MLSAAVVAEGNLLLPTIPDLLWGTIVFVIVLVFFIVKALPAINKLLDERRDAIDGGIERAEKKQAEANAVLERYTAQLAEARAEAGRIREQARTEGAAILAELRENANAEAARITANAQAQIESERAGALASLRAEVGSLALDLSSRIVGEVLADDKRAVAVVDRFLADLEQDQLSKASE